MAVLCVAATLVFLGSAGAGVTAFSSASRHADSLHNMRGYDSTINEARAQWLTDDDAMNMYVALKSLHDPSQDDLASTQQKTLEDAYSATLDALKKAKTQATDAKDQDLINGLLSDLPTYQGFTEKMIADVQANRIVDGVTEVTVNNADISQSIQDRFAKISELTTAGANRQDHDLKVADKRGTIALVIVAVCGVALLLVLGWILTRIVARSLRTTSGTTTDAATRLHEVATAMGQSAGRTAQKSELVATSSEQLRTNMTTVAAAIEQMQASVGEIAQSAGRASVAGTEAVDTVSATNERVASLGVASQEIGKVIEVITSIAEQTNLLALNATIEAARAGEAGKGFAVVANEVKELAKATADATGEISSRIVAIQSETSDTTAAIDSVSAVIERINDMQRTIAAAVEEQTASTTEIARSVHEAALSSDSIARHIAEVSKEAKDTAEGANTTQLTANSMMDVSNTLRQMAGIDDTSFDIDHRMQPRRDFESVPGRTRADNAVRSEQEPVRD